MPALLNSELLKELPPHVKGPSYRPSEHGASIVHLGIGAFHKAHQAVYTDDLLSACAGDWRINAVSLRSPSVRDQLAPQDYLYTVTEKHNGKSEHRVIAAINKVLVAPENPLSVIELLADIKTKVVTCSITEKGYCLTPSNTVLDLRHPDIVHDINNLSSPKTMAGYVVAACLVRRQRGLPGFTFLSCDNLPDNGKTAGYAISQLAERIDSTLAEWIALNVSFCNTMVDRIVPAVTDAEKTQLHNAMGFCDDALVSCEPFRQWVIEDNFIDEKPPWHLVGAQFVADVSDYEKMKLRLLNGSHSALAYMGKLLDHDYIYQAIQDEDLSEFVDILMEDVASTLPAIEGVDFDKYQLSIKTRFANTDIPYTTQQVATDGSKKLPQRILQPLLECINKGRISKPLCLVIAAWIHYLKGSTNTGKAITINDPLSAPLNTLVDKYRYSSMALVKNLGSQTGVFPDELMSNQEFLALVSRYVYTLDELPLRQLIVEINHKN